MSSSIPAKTKTYSFGGFGLRHQRIICHISPHVTAHRYLPPKRSEKQLLSSIDHLLYLSFHASLFYLVCKCVAKDNLALFDLSSFSILPS